MSKKKWHYKVYRYKTVIYWFTTTKRNLEYCLEQIEQMCASKEYYKVYMNDEMVFEKRSNKGKWQRTLTLGRV